MITGTDFYHVMTSVVPLYVAMVLAYGSVRWWNIFTPAQCSGINRFVALFAVPLLSFHFISTNNPYAMNLRFIAADSLQKLLVLAAVAAWSRLSRHGSLDWAITLFSLATLPNTLVMGIPLLKGMYGGFSGGLMVQIVVLQCIIWYTLMLFLFEFRAARILISEQFPDGTAGAIASIAVDSDVVSLDGRREPLETEAEVGADGRIRIKVRRSNASASDIYSRQSHGGGGGFGATGATPRPSNLTNAEIYSLQSSRNPTPRGSSFNHTDFFSMVGGGGGGGRSSNFSSADAFGLAPGATARGSNTPRPSNFEEEYLVNPHPSSAGGKTRFGHYNPPGTGSAAARTTTTTTAGGKDLHMFVWSSSASPVSDAFGGQTAPPPPPSSDQAAKDVRLAIIPAGAKAEGRKEEYSEEQDDFSFAGNGPASEGGGGGQGYDDEKEAKGQQIPAAAAPTMPPTSVMTRLILIMVWRKLIRNPNTYSSLIGLTWSLVSFRWNIQMPAIISMSISILSDAGLGMAMFSLGLFMALQPRIIACGNSVAVFAMAIRFLTGPAVMAVSSVAVGLRGVLLRVAVVQAALPQGIVPFVFAKEYNVHPDILSTGVIFGMLIALPITLLYYILLGL